MDSEKSINSFNFIIKWIHCSNDFFYRFVDNSSALILSEILDIFDMGDFFFRFKLYRQVLKFSNFWLGMYMPYIIRVNIEKQYFTFMSEILRETSMLFLFSSLTKSVLLELSCVVWKSRSLFPDSVVTIIFGSSGTKHITCCSCFVIRNGISDMSAVNAASIGLLDFNTLTPTCKFSE